MKKNYDVPSIDIAVFDDINCSAGAAGSTITMQLDDGTELLTLTPKQGTAAAARVARFNNVIKYTE